MQQNYGPEVQYYLEHLRGTVLNGGTKVRQLLHDAFAKAFPSESDPITLANVQKAIAVFEATLITPNAPMDKGCSSCHNGINVGVHNPAAAEALLDVARRRAEEALARTSWQ